MPLLKTRCPECDAGLRLTVDGDGEHEVECPKCDHSFTATLEDETPRKPAKAAKRRDEEDEEEDERPVKRKRKQEAAGPNSTLLIGGIAGGLLLVGAIVAIVFAFSGSKEKPVAQNDPPPQQPVQPTPQPPNPAPPKPGPNPPKPNPGPGPVEPPEPNPNPNPPIKPVPPQVAEDVFARAASFKPDGPLPELPPLPPVDRRPMLTLDPGGHTAFVKHVFFTPDASRVITVADDKSVRVWDVQSGEVLYTVRLPAGPADEGRPYSAALSPDGNRLAVGIFPLNKGAAGLPIYILAVEDGKLLKVITGAREVVTALDFSPDGNRLAVGCGNGVLQVHDIPSGKWTYQVLAHNTAVRQVRYNPKRAVVSSVGSDQDVKIWALSDATKFAAQLKLPEQKPNVADWSSDGNTLAVGCTNGEVLLHNAAGKLLQTLPPALEDGKHPIQVARMKFLPGDKQLVFGGVSALGWAGIVDIESKKHPVIIKDHTNTVMAVNRSADGALCVSAGGENNEVIVWKAKDGAIVRKFQSTSKALWAVGWGKDGKSLAWGAINRHGGDGLCPLEHTLRLDEFVLGPPPEPGAFVRHVRDDGTTTVKVDSFFQITVSANGRAVYQHKSLHDRIYSVTVLPGKGVLVGASFGMYLLDLKQDKVIREYRGDGGLTTALAPSPDGRYFVSGSTDQVMRVWAIDRDEPVLSIFTVGREWIAWTPQGYYACSPFGERLIGWQVNAGANQLPAVHPAVRFRASLYQPALIKYLIPAGDIRLALAMASRFDRQQIAATGLADVLPPGVTITVPAQADDKPITISAVAEGNAKNPIVAMRLLIDGRPYNGAAGVKKFNKQVKAEATWEVTLDPGSHTLAVLAESPVSKGMSPVAAVSRAGAEALPNLYVLAMGVSAYPGKMKLNYAASDAVLLKKTFEEKSRGVFGTVEVKLVVDQQATKKGIQEGLNWLKSKMTAKDVGIVSFSGHGGKDDDTDKFYLIPIDVGPDLERTCLSGEELKSRLEDMPGRLIAILDACHSGAVADMKQPARADNLVRDLMTDDYGVVVLASSLGREYSLESSATKAGFYTLGLAEGMSGRADYNRDGVILLNELEYYAAFRVQELSGGRQNPTTGRPPTIKPFAIAKP